MIKNIFFCVLFFLISFISIAQYAPNPRILLDGVELGEAPYVVKSENNIAKSGKLNIIVNGLNIAKNSKIHIALAKVSNGEILKPYKIDFFTTAMFSGLTGNYYTYATINNTNAAGVDISSLPCGTYIVALYDNTQNTTPKFEDSNKIFDNISIFLTIERKETFTQGGMNFEVFYTDNAFLNKTTGTKNIATYLGYVKDGIVKAWNRQINIFQFPVPTDSDNTYKIYLNDCDDASTFQYHPSKYTPGYGIYSSAEVGIKSIYLRIDPLSYLNPNNQQINITEDVLVRLLLFHEFFHGIQYSYIDLNKIITSYPTTYVQEIFKRQWLIEGQANFIETLYSGTVGAVEPAFILKSHYGSYDMFTSLFIETALYKNYRSVGIQSLGYQYSLYWRHLYEHSHVGTLIQKVMTESLIQMNTINNSDLPSVKKIMDAALMSWSGTNSYKTYDESLIAFAKMVYLTDNSWQKWDDPNGNNFYAAAFKTDLANGLLFSDLSFQNDPTCNNSKTDNNSINESFGFKFYEHFNTSPTCNDTKVIEFAYNNSLAKFNVCCMELKGTTVVKTTDIVIDKTTQKGKLIICSPNADKYVIVVTRLDENEATIGSGQYSLTIKNENSSNPIIDFTPTQNSSKTNYTIDFTDLSNTTNFENTNFTMNGASVSTTLPFSQNLTTGGKFTFAYSGDYCGTTQTKAKDVHILPCYIESLTIKEMTSGKNNNFTRTYNGTAFSFSSNYNVTITTGNSIQVEVKTSLPLAALKCRIVDSDGKEYAANSIIIPYGAKSTIFSPTLVTSGIKNTGIYFIECSAIDASGKIIPNTLINVKQPSVAPVTIDPTQQGLGLNLSTITGVDKNYDFLCKSSDLKSDVLAEYKSSCTDYTVKFYNFMSEILNINFGDGKSGTIPPNSFITHTYPIANKKYNYIIKTSNGVTVKSSKIIFKKPN